MNRLWSATSAAAVGFGVSGSWIPGAFDLGPNEINYAATPPDVVAAVTMAPADPFTGFPLAS